MLETNRYFRYNLDGCSFVFLTRNGGVSKPPYDSMNLSYTVGDDSGDVARNYENALSHFQIRPEKLVKLEQTHNSDVMVIRRDSATRDSATRDSMRFDAVVTNDTTLCLRILTADCVPLLLFDTNNRVLAAVHAGWRGTAAGITKKAVDIMIREFSCNPADITAAIGPSIGACCYTISSDVLEMLKASVSENTSLCYNIKDNEIYADLKKFNAAQLVESGIQEVNIMVVERCTCCAGGLFFSYRKERVTGRQMSIAFMGG